MDRHFGRNVGRTKQGLGPPVGQRWLRSSNLSVDSSFDTYMPIFVSLRLANSSIKSDKQKNPSFLIYKMCIYYCSKVCCI